MTTDYTLPPLPESLGVISRMQYTEYGQQCAEAGRAPLLARLRDVCQTLVAAVGADGPCSAEDAAARAVARIAELEADAKRYRWLRDSDGDAWFDAYGVLGSALVSDLVDQAIDKAMNEGTSSDRESGDA